MKESHLSHRFSQFLLLYCRVKKIECLHTTRKGQIESNWRAPTTPCN